jgi:hypothetical protein
MKYMVFILVVAPILFFPTTVHADLVGIDFSGGIYQIDESTAAILNTATTTSRLNSLSLNSTGDYYSIRYYGWNDIGSYPYQYPQNNRNILTRIDDPITGTSTSLDPVNVTIADPIQVEAVGFSSNDTFYALSNPGTTPGVNDLLYSIDISNGTGSYLGYFSDPTDPYNESARLSYVTSMAFSSDDTLYIWDGSWGLVTADLTTMTYTDVNPSLNSWGGQGSASGQTSPSISAIAFGADGTMYGTGRAIDAEWYDPNFLFSIDPATGAASVIGSFGSYYDDTLDIRGLEYYSHPEGSEMSPIPEPTSILLLGTGLGALGLVAYRRKRK